MEAFNYNLNIVYLDSYELWYTPIRNVNWYMFWRKVYQIKNLKMFPSFEPEILLWGLYPEEIIWDMQEEGSNKLLISNK